VKSQYSAVAKMIDHSLLNPALAVKDLEAGCEVALRYEVASVCILPYYARRCAELLTGSTVVASTTIGFPHGGHHMAIKLAEVDQAIADGARELDMVVNISKVLSGDYGYVGDEIAAICEKSHASGARVKVIFENCYLNNDQKITLCKLCTQAGADWVKTSTGYGLGGFTFEDISLMLANVGPGVQVKAAGGVRDLDTLFKLKVLGVTRCGATRTAQMLDEVKARLERGTLTV
jgi:deoxyribose-phosphate aldolase